MVVSKEDYIKQDKKEVVIECPHKHVSTFSFNSYMNKKGWYTNGKIDNFCAECKNGSEREEKKEEYIQKVKDKTGHDLLEIDISTREVMYRCGNCYQVSHSFISNLLLFNKGHCGNCENWDTKIPYERLKQKVGSMGVELLTKPEEYINNKMLLSIICACGNPDKKALSDIMKGKGCKEFCKSRKLAETCMERYGVSNPSQHPEIFEKITRSLFRRKEYVFPQTGRVISLMGYEPQAVDYLLGQKVDRYLGRSIAEEEIQVGKDVPRFGYDDGKVYFPDLYIEEKKMVMEVKGDWTLHQFKDSNRRKFSAVIRDGYSLRLLLFYENGEVQEDMLFSREEDLTQLDELEFRGKGRRY
jgi:hypothetical protein